MEFVWFVVFQRALCRMYIRLYSVFSEAMNKLQQVVRKARMSWLYCKRIYPVNAL
jgi:hypothetical protein